MYAIHAEYFYYQGTINAPTDGVIAAYDSKVDAEMVMNDLIPCGHYYLPHGCYAAPQYKIIGYRKPFNWDNPDQSGVYTLRESSRDLLNAAKRNIQNMATQ